MSDTATLPAPPQRKCSIEEVFDASFIELLKLVPTNPFVRAWVLKFSGKLPPVECVTFEQLKDWVEFNCMKRLRPKSSSPRSTDEDGIEINVHFSEMEYGRANYSVDRWGDEPFQIGSEELMELIQRAIADGGAVGDVVDAVAGLINDDAWNRCDPDLDHYGDHEYNEHESDDSDSGEIRFSRDHIRQKVLQFVQAHHPELAAEL
jgi:hypothetical protein